MTAFKLPSKSAVYKQIRDVGITRATLKRVLPAWWDDALLQSNSGFLQFAKLLDQRLGLSVTVSDGNVSFLPAKYTIQYKKRAHIDIQQLSDATYLCQAVANTLITVLEYNHCSPNLSRLQQSLDTLGELTLANVLPLFWASHIPVIHVSRFPANVARPAGMVMRSNNHYAIVLGHKHKSPSTQLFVLLHELGHILCDHLTQDGSLTDSVLPELGESLDVETDPQEDEADAYALRLLRKDIDIVSMVRELGRLNRPAELAIKAKRASQVSGISAGHFALTYGRETRDWILTQQALRFLEKGNAIATLQSSFIEAMEQLDVRSQDSEFLMSMQTG
ncbi:hypothetical protein GMES_1377 [Paraglaciecola mesophila KMM 241]|uniref:IrrE N-terminal-like domain-containing protein n=1 Tax=Paraglaciecola mesophila KMM 241 TaxID=1128912 RepID=K6YI54_9ALTE|nr:ImmA/IrrE family metallo-endopeptidase [Paraglaciecola mesophila]GAC23676.1 hypothetical protein GMES_1377 [Paraglaciecola mesophila KMM 241]